MSDVMDDQAGVNWLTCPRCLAYGYHLVLDAKTIDCYDCRYVGVPERREWSGLYLEERWAAIAHANGKRASDSAEIRLLLETIDLAAAAGESVGIDIERLLAGPGSTHG
jgi:hypothetical protein